MFTSLNVVMAISTWVQRLIYLKRRFAQHQAGHVQSTKVYLPVKLKSYVAVETKLKARQLEKYFKSGSGKAIALKRFL